MQQKSPRARATRCGSALQDKRKPREKPRRREAKHPERPLRSALRSRAPRARPALRLRPALKSAPSSASCCPESPRAGTRQRARAGICHVRPDSASLRIRADRGSSSAHPGFSPRSGSESFLFSSRSALRFSPFPSPGPASGLADKKSPGGPGRNMGKGKAKENRSKARPTTEK